MLLSLCFKNLKSWLMHTFINAKSLLSILTVFIVVLTVSLLIILQSVELDRLAVYLDSDIVPWHVDKSWEKLLPSEWLKVLLLVFLI